MKPRSRDWTTGHLVLGLITAMSLSVSASAQTPDPQSLEGSRANIEGVDDVPAAQSPTEEAVDEGGLPLGDGTVSEEMLELQSLEAAMFERLRVPVVELQEAPYEALEPSSFALDDPLLAPVAGLTGTPRFEWIQEADRAGDIATAGSGDVDEADPELAPDAELAQPLEHYDLEGVRPFFGIEDLDQPGVQTYLHFYNTDGRRRMARLLSRMGRYHDQLVTDLEDAGLPTELVYLVMIESGFNPTARSHAAAVGLWQFIAPTGRAYDLVVNRRYDERQDPVLATQAAIAYLSNLYERFGSWPLAMAGYNAGGGHVRREIRRYNLNEFWAMDAYSAIYDDTRSYVCRILAVAIIGEYPERFGFESVEPEPAIVYDTVTVPGRTRLSTLARAAGTDVETLRELNPSLLVSSLPDLDEYDLHIPLGMTDAFVEDFDGIVLDEIGEVHFHLVRVGETIEDVSDLYGISQRAIRSANGFARGVTLEYEVEIVIPIDAETGTLALEIGEVWDDDHTPPVVIVPDLAFDYPEQRRVFYEVLADDQLVRIASALDVSVYDLGMWNDVDADAVLYSGMYLQAWVPPDADLSLIRTLGEDQVQVFAQGSDEYSAWDEAEERGRRRSRSTYTVRRGDTLGGIARRHGVSTRNLMRWNNIDDPNRIRSGMRLRVR